MSVTVKQKKIDIKELLQKDARYKAVFATMAKHRKRHDALIEVLHTTEDVFGYIPLEAMRFIGSEMRIAPSRIYGVVTFYHFFSLKPKGDHTCTVCTGTACYVKGSQKIVDHIEKNFYVKPGTVTADNRLGLQTARCVGACGLAPVVIVDAEIFAKAGPEEAEKAVRVKLGEKP